ncbi:aspartate/glutamate racemase family protein [Streptomyces sp. NBC_01262]|uniref:aspartate/glutamate racemase family protein n=1 Tax=Streptomyces sp. NBC_01262 TaxID=2903803 RepID=UPI002E36FBEF|nr:hypothetical protein [Streptomyces sp. NBC_01262]
MAEYYRLLNELTRERLGGRGRGPGGRRQAAGGRRQAAGADMLLLCTNTMHKVADQVAAAVRSPSVHEVIYDELCLGVVREESRRDFRAVIADLVAAGAEGVVFGCTEIERLIGPPSRPGPVGEEIGRTR